MNKIRVTISGVLLALLLMPVIVYASDISNAKYYGVITISKNGTATTNVATVCDISTPVLIAGNYLNASANNSVIRSSSGVDVNFMPGCNATLPWCLWVPSIGTNAYTSNILYTANSTGGLIRYFPDTAGANITDDDTLEPRDNFGFEIKGWVDTDYEVDKNLIVKPDAFYVYVSDDEEISAAIVGTDNFTQSYQVSHNDDDCRRYWTGAAWAFEKVTLTYTGYANGAASFKAGSAFRFNSVNITQGQLILSANVTFTGADNQAQNDVDSRITGEDADNAATFVDLANFEARTHTTANVTWDAIGAWVINGEYDTPDIRDIIQEIVNRPGWVAGNSIVIFWEDWEGRSTAVNGTYRTAEDHDTTPAEAAVLNINALIPGVTATGVSSGEYTVTVTSTDNGSLLFTNGGGATQDVDFDFPGVINLGNENVYTIELWMYPTSTGSEVAFSEGNSGSNTPFIAVEIRDVAGGIAFLHQDDAANQASSSWVAPANAWYHVVGTRIAANSWELFVNGVSRDTDNTAVGVTTLDNAHIGIYQRTADLFGFDGNVDDVRIYVGRAMLLAEVVANYNGGAGLSEPSNPANLVAHWALDDYSGTSVADVVGTNTGTLTGAAWDEGFIPSQFSISIDGAKEDGKYRATVPDNNNAWYLVENDVMPYMEYYKHSVNGTLVSHIVWEYDDSVFTDLSGYGNDAYPSFRTASSDEDVSANMASFLPIAEARAPSYALDDPVPFVEIDTANVTDNWTITPTAGGFPLAGVIIAVANATGTPPQLPLLVIAGFVILALSLAVSAVMRGYGSGTIFVKLLIIAAVMGVFVAMGNFGINMWMVITFLIIAVAMAMASKQVGFS